MEFRFEHAQSLYSVKAERDGESFRVRIGERAIWLTSSARRAASWSSGWAIRC